MTSCDVFSVRTELERCSLMTECLPYLHIICKNEKERETNGTKRRLETVVGVVSGILLLCHWLAIA